MKDPITTEPRSLTKRKTTMKDPITTAFVVKGAVTHPQYSMYLEFMPEGEVESVQFLTTAADILETEYEKFDPSEFDHLVFSYDIAEPFGERLIEQTIAYEGEVPTDSIAEVAKTLLEEHRRGVVSPDEERILIDRQFSTPGLLANYYSKRALSEHPMFTLKDWRAEVVRETTQEGYWDWVYNEVHNWEESQ